MTMVLSGDGTVTGLVAGGLPDATVQTADVVDAAITPAKLSGGQTGSAPVYGCRAWCTFNGTTAGTNAPIAGGNVTNVTKNGTGDYTVNFTTAMADTNYATVVNSAHVGSLYPAAPLAGSVRVQTYTSQTGVSVDDSIVSVAIFR